jgi:hypothetical protein
VCDVIVVVAICNALLTVPCWKIRMDKQKLNKGGGCKSTEMLMRDNGKQKKTFNQRKVKGVSGLAGLGTLKLTVTYLLHGAQSVLRS